MELKNSTSKILMRQVLIRTSIAMLCLVLSVTLVACWPFPYNTPTPSTPTPTSVQISTPTPATTPLTSEKNPVILLHGWKGSFPDGLFASCDDSVKLTPLPITTDDLNGVDGELLDLGYPVYRLGLISSPCYTPPITTNVPLLTDKITQVLNETHKTKVIIIAHSLGGLVARAYIEGPNYRDPGDVSDLFTIGTPHVGLIDLRRNWLSILFAPDKINMFKFGSRQEVFRDFAFGSMAAQYPQRNPSVRYHIIDGVPQQLSSKGALVEFVLGNKPIDGLVPTWSGKGLRGDLVSDSFEDVVYLEAHSRDLGTPDYFAPGTRTHQYLIRALTTPTTTVTPVPPPPTETVVAITTPQLVCDAGKFIDLLDKAQDDIEGHVADALGEYSIDCGPQGITAQALVEEALRHDMAYNLVGVSAPGLATAANFVVSTTTGLRAGALQDGTTLAEIPDSRVVTTQDAIYVFYPATDVSTTLTGNFAGNVTVRAVRGTNASNLNSEGYETIVGPNENVVVPPGLRPDLRRYDNNNPTVPKATVLPRPLTDFSGAEINPVNVIEPQPEKVVP